MGQIRIQLVLSIVVFILMACTQNMDNLYLIEVNEKNGFINENGEVVIPPEYIYATDFIDNIALVVTDTLFSNDVDKFSYKYNYINNKNNKIFKDDFTLKAGVLLYMLQDDRKQVQEHISKFIFSCGLALNVLYDVEPLYGYINVKGDTIVPHKYADGLPFRENKTFVQQSNFDLFEKLQKDQYTIDLLEYNKKWKIINNLNSDLTDYMFIESEEFPIIPYCNNRSIGYTAIDEDGEFKCIANLLDENGRIIKVMPSLGEELSKLMTNVGQGTLPDAWSYGLSFTISDSLVVQHAGVLSYWGIDSRFFNPYDGTEIPSFDQLSIRDKSIIKCNSYFIAPTNYASGANIPISYSKEFSEGLIPCKYTKHDTKTGNIGPGKWFYVNKHKCIIGREDNGVFCEALPFSNGLAAVKRDGKWGYINKHFELVIPYQYDSADSFIGSLAKVETRKGGMLISSYINKFGQVVWQNIRYSDPQLVK